MNFAFYIKLYILTVPVFFAIDMLWLGLVARSFYKRHLGFIISPEVNWVAALVFYFIFIIGILIFSVLPALEKDSLIRAVVFGALFGFFTYATYDLTNLATIKDWPLTVVIIDIIWGSLLCASVSAGAYMIGRWLQS